VTLKWVEIANKGGEDVGNKCRVFILGISEGSGLVMGWIFSSFMMVLRVLHGISLAGGLEICWQKSVSQFRSEIGRGTGLRGVTVQAGTGRCV